MWCFTDQSRPKLFSIYIDIEHTLPTTFKIKWLAKTYRQQMWSSKINTVLLTLYVFCIHVAELKSSFTLTYKTIIILMQVTILIIPVGFDKVLKNVNPQGWAITLSDEISSHYLNKSISSSTQTSLTTLWGGSIIERFGNIQEDIMLWRWIDM